jgi:hypothetical protein
MPKANSALKEIAATFPDLKFSDTKIPKGSNAEVFVLVSNDGERDVLKAIDTTKRKGKDLEGTEEAALAAVKSEYVIPLLQLKEHGRYKFSLFSVH